MNHSTKAPAINPGETARGLAVGLQHDF